MSLIIYRLLMFLGLSMMFIGMGSMIHLSLQEDRIIETECYDRYGHEIQGLICEKNLREEYYLVYALIACLGALISAFSYVNQIGRESWI